MIVGFLLRLFLALSCFAGFLYAYLNKQNTITQLRLEIPALAKELDTVNAHNIRLQFEIDQFEDPSYLMELARRPEFRHLVHPLEKDIVTLSVP